MKPIEIRTETPIHAYKRVSEEFEEIESLALGPDSTARDINRYNQLHEQIKRKHHDGTIGHLHLKREIVLFDRFSLPAPDKRVPFKPNPKA